MLLIIAAAAVLIVAWITAFRIRIDSEKLSYRTLGSLLHGERWVRWEDIASAEIAAGPPRGLKITERNATGPLVINLKVFDRADVTALLGILRIQAPLRTCRDV